MNHPVQNGYQWGGSYELSYESSVSIKGDEFLD